MLLGPRIGKYANGTVQAIPGHNMSIATLGALILWIGWYGFNPGSQLAMDQWVAYVAVTTTLGAAGGDRRHGDFKSPRRSLISP